MTGFLTRLLGRFLVYTFLIHITIFLATNLLLPDPARSFLGPNARQDEVDALRREMGLDRNLPVRYFIQVSQAIHLDFGISSYYQESAGKVVASHLGITLLGVFTAQFIALLFGIYLGRTLWGKNGRLGIWIVNNLSFWVQSVPGFILLVLIAAVFRVWFGITPLGYPRLFAILASIIASLFSLGAITTWTIGALEKTARSEPFILVSAGLGIPWNTTLTRLIRLILPGAISLSLHAFGITFLTYFFAEYIFNLKGFGNLLFLAVSRSDFPIIITGSLVSAVIILGLQTLSDLTTRLLDPREKHVSD